MEETNTNKPQGLFQKLLWVRQHIESLNKSDENKFHKFSFVSSTNCLSVVRPLLDQVGVLLVPRVTNTTLHFIKTDRGKGEQFTELCIEYKWIDVESKQELICEWYGQGSDSSEKGVGKALTYAEKYFFLKFFQIPTDEADPDEAKGDNGNTRPQPTRTDAQACELLAQNSAIVDDYLRHDSLPDFRIGYSDTWEVLKNDPAKWKDVVQHTDKLVKTALEYYKKKHTGSGAEDEKWAQVLGGNP